MSTQVDTGSHSGIYHLHKEERIYNNNTLSFSTFSSTSSTISPTQKCVCRYLWRRELHGLSQLMMTKTLASRLFWLSLLILCFVVAILNTNYMLGSYLSHDTATRMRIKQVKSMNLPQMVFCPNYPDTLHIEPLIEGKQKDGKMFSSGPNQSFFEVDWHQAPETTETIYVYYMVQHIGYHQNDTYFDIIKYMIAGSGFDGVPMYTFSGEYKEGLRKNLEMWRGNRSIFEFFQFVFEENGYNCGQFFYKCSSGASDVDCCEMFEPVYVMLRGRCFKLKKYSQNGNDELAKLKVYIRPLDSPILGRSLQPLIIMNLGDHNREVSTFPRFYFGLHNWNKIRFDRKVIKSLPSNPRCSSEPRDQGRHTCIVYKWIMGLVDKYNCTLPYYKTLDYMYTIPVCDPSVVVDNYDDIKWPRLERYPCRRACHRDEIQVSLTSTTDYSGVASLYGYRFEAAFNELQYEEFEEVQTTSLQSFISELGGQTGLFLGISLLTFVQLIVSIVCFICAPVERWIQKKMI